MIAFCPLEGREQMPAKNRRKLPNIYILHRSFVFIKYIYIYETRMVESGNNRNFGRKEAKVSDGDIEYLEY